MTVGRMRADVRRGAGQPAAHTSYLLGGIPRLFGGRLFHSLFGFASRVTTPEVPPPMDDPSPASREAEARKHSTEELFPILYDELRRLAAQKIAREVPGQTLQATSLVHEVFVRLAKIPSGPAAQQWESRTHFFCAAAEAMRRILVDIARRKHSEKRGGGRPHVPLDAESVMLAAGASKKSLDVLALDEALTELEQLEPEKAQLVKLRFFAGLSMQEAADVLGVSRATANRRWTYARAWLYGKLAEQVDPTPV